MPASNTSGTPDVRDYNLGRGAIYFYDLLADGSPGAGRHVGNCSEFTLTVERETLEHQASLSGLKVTDLQVTISQEVSYSITFEEINAENLAAFFSGEVGTFANAAAIAGFTNDLPWIAAVEFGRWYDIVDEAGARVYNIAASTLTLTASTALALDDADNDYIVDEVWGRIFFPEVAGLAGLTAGEEIDIVVAANASAGTIQQVLGLTTSPVARAIKFVGENAANADKPFELQIHRTKPAAEGDMALIGDELSAAQLSGVTERSTYAGHAASPYLTVRTLPHAS